MNFRNALLILIIGALAAQSAIAQIAQGDKAYNRMAFAEATSYYEHGLKKDTANYAAWSKLADCYRRNGDARNAERAYAKVIKGNGGSSNDQYFHILMLLQNTRYAEAKNEIIEFKSKNTGDTRIEAVGRR